MLLNENKLIFVNYALSNTRIIMSFKKKREIKANAFSLTGSVKSIKRNALVDFESSLERDYIHVLENDPSVVTYYEQPLKIYHENGMYIPDFLIQYESGKETVVEIKYRDDLRKNFTKYKTKFKAAIEFCKANNMEFKIITEEKIRTPYLFNVKFLSNYRKNHLKNDYTDPNMLYDNLKKLQRSTPKELVAFTSSDKAKQAELIYHLWSMVLTKRINLDMQQKINMNSEIWI